MLNLMLRLVGDQANMGIPGRRLHVYLGEVAPYPLIAERLRRTALIYTRFPHERHEAYRGVLHIYRLRR